MPKKETVERLDAQEETIPTVTTEEISTAAATVSATETISPDVEESTDIEFPLKNLKAIGYSKGLSIDEVIDLLQLSDGNLTKMNENFKQVKMLSYTHQITMREVISYFKYKNENKVQDN